MIGLSPLFFLFVLAYMPKLEYDAALGALKRVASNPLDGSPLVLGLVTIFKQFHPSFLELFIAYCGQFIRSKINDVAQQESVVTLPPEVVNLLIFLTQMARAAHVKSTMLHSHIPAYVLDAMQLSSS